MVRLLVIEDDPDLNRQLAGALTDAGYVVDRAFDGEEGHYLGETEPYDAIILDIGLPRMDGYQVARRLRAAFGRDILLVAYTAYGEPDVPDLTDQRCEDGGPLLAECPLDGVHAVVGAPTSMTGRTSTVPYFALGTFAAQASAASRSGASIT